MTEAPIIAPDLREIRAAGNLIAPYVVRTPLLRLNISDKSKHIYLKLENLQPIGVFKVRSMANIMLSEDKDILGKGVYTASSGNAGIGLAWMADKLGFAARVYVPESGPVSKLDAVKDLGAEIDVLSNDDWWQIIENSGHPKDPGFYVDAVRSRAALAGNATIGLEIIEQLPAVDSIIVPFGGGGVACGIASAIAELKPDTKIIVAESETAAPVTAALEAGLPVTIETLPSFISGAGAPSVLKEMWPLVGTMVNGTVVVPATEVADAVRILFEKNRIVAEGAGALPVAGALAGNTTGSTVCVVTGGNIDPEMMTRILSGQTV